MSMALTAGIIRVAFWFLAFAASIYYRRVVATILFLAVFINSTIFMFSNAGIEVPEILFNYAVLASTPIAAAFAIGMIQNSKQTGGRRDKWSAW